MCILNLYYQQEKYTKINKLIRTLINKLETLTQELLDTFLTPEKYPEREVVIDTNGRLIASIYNGLTEILFANKLDTKKGEHTNKITAESMPKNKL